MYLTAIGLPPGGSSTVHIYTQTIRRTTQSTQTMHGTTQFKIQYIEQHNYASVGFRKLMKTMKSFNRTSRHPVQSQPSNIWRQRCYLVKQCARPVHSVSTHFFSAASPSHLSCIRSMKQDYCYTKVLVCWRRWLTLRRRIKSHLLFAGIIRSSPFSLR